VDRDPAAGSSRIDDRDTTPINDDTMTIRVASGEATGGFGGFEPPPTCLQDNSWDSYKTADKFFWEGGRGTPLSCFSLLEIVTVQLDQKK
jgi:hypothetical protein